MIRQANPTQDLQWELNGLAAVMILTYEEHIPLLENILDTSEVLSWMVLPTAQSRRLGGVQNSARRDTSPGNVIVAFGAGWRLRLVVKLVCQARELHAIRQECAIFRWPVEPLAGLPFQTDPVCDKAVDSSHSLVYRYGSEAFYFCSETCRDAFITDPARYLARRDSPCRVDRRDLKRNGFDTPDGIFGERLP